MGKDWKEPLLQGEQTDETTQPSMKDQARKEGTHFVKEIIRGFAQIGILGQNAQRAHIRRELESRLSKNQKEEEGYSPPSPHS